MIDELIREITAPDAESAQVRESARARLLDATKDDRRLPRRFGIGRRGLALIATLLAIPAGVAVATELRGSDAAPLELADCPELQAAVDGRDLDLDDLQLLTCPAGDDVAKTVSLIEALKTQRAFLDKRLEGKHVTVVGNDRRGPWALDGIAGPVDGSKPIGSGPRSDGK